jgi:hypothetical protein
MMRGIAIWSVVLRLRSGLGWSTSVHVRYMLVKAFVYREGHLVFASKARLNVKTYI